jgi:hypothetical protein
MLGHGGKRHVEPRGELADRGIPGREPRENRAPGGIRERGERRVQRGSMVNHVVYYYSFRRGPSSRHQEAPRNGFITDHPGFAGSLRGHPDLAAQSQLVSALFIKTSRGFKERYARSRA